MKKSYFWGLLIAIMALIPSQNAFADYCTMSSTFSNTDRHLDSFTLTDGVEELAVSSAQPNSGSNWRASYKVYNDHTSKSLTTQPGATLHFKSLSWTGSWMHGYVFIDYNQDETFDASEAVSYNFYSEAGESTGLNSKGESVSNNCGVTAGNMPSWTLPSDLASGSYRLRFKIDWNSLDACGASDIVSNRGCILDLTLNVEAAIPERTIDVTVTPEGAGTVTGAGTAMGNITLTATATPGYEFVNWTLDGEVVGTDMSYTDATEGNKSYVANFAALTAYPEMSYLYTNGVSQANRYLKEVVATAGETVTTVFSATTETELPKVDPDVTGSATTQGAYVDKTENPIIIPEGTTEFTVNFKAWTTAMTISGTSATTQLNWTQQAVFIDWNNNFCFYEEGENYGKNGDGMPNADFIAADGFVRTFSVPAGVQPGVYRMRVCYYEPDGNNAQQWQNTIFEKGNCVTRNGKTYDFAVEVQAVVAPSFEVTVSVNDEAMGSAKKVAGENDEFTLTATAKDGYEFVNWTVADAEVSTENPYVFTATENVEVVANFQVVAQWPATMELINAAKELIVKDGVGFPSATAKATFKEALDAAEANTTIASLAPLQAAMDTYMAETDVVAPEAGKTYAFVAAMSETTQYYIYNNGTALALAQYAGELPESAYFTCSMVGEKYAFQSVVDNKYMAIPQPVVGWLVESTVSVSGLEDTAKEVAQFEVLKLAEGANANVTASAEQLFGMVYLFGSRGTRTDNGNQEPGVIIVNSSAAFDKSNSPFCNGSFTSAIRVVEVDYNTTPVYAVTVNAGVGGTVEASATEVEEGTEVTFTATASEGYAFVNWTAGEEVVSTENPYTVAVTADIELTANFEMLPVIYTVTVNAGIGGTAEASATEVEEGTEVTLTATAAEGYTFAGWTTPETTPVYYIQNYNTKKYLGYNSSNLAAIDEQSSDVTIAPSTMNEGEFTIYLTNATYDQQTPPQAQSYLHCGSNGRFSGNSVNTSASQQIAIFKVEDPTAETITATKVSEITSGATYMFVGLKNDVYYALTDELYKEGTTDQRMVGAAVEITDGTISFVPGTTSALWTISNKAFDSTENPYTVTVTANAEFTANFVEVPVVKYAVSVTTVDGAMGTAEVSATEVKEGDEVTFTATANLGYKFIGWLADGETVSTENPYTTAITAEMALVANFEALTPAIIVTNDVVNAERQFTFDAFVEGAKILIDWGNGELQEYDIAYFDSWTTWTTTITGTVLGEGVVKIYGDQIRSFDCSYSASYPVKVTSLDLTGCPNLYELVCNSNQLTALDLSANTALAKLTANNSAFASGVDLSANTALTTIDFNDAGLPSIDLSNNTALTSVKLNNNALGSIDVSANTALTTLYANNTGLTTIDLSANTVLKNLYVNENQLTSLNISNMVAGSYTFANDNQLTELITAPAMLTSKTRINIKNNNFTLATLPVITGINAYNYAPQNAMTIATEITEGEELDLSSQAMVGENATVYAWYTTEGEEFTGYTVEGGKFVFDVEADTELYCTMTNASFASFSGANVFKTTNIVVKALIPAIVVTVTPDVERQFSFEVATASKLFIDWGNGELVETETIVASDPDPSWIPYLPTTINGTPVGEGVVKIYGDGITYFDCSYSASYPSKVTSLDVTNATSLIALEACTNEIATLDLSNQSSLLKLTAYSNPSLSTIVWPTTNVLTSVTLNDCALAEIDFSSCTALTALNVNNNTGLGGIDVSALTALTTLRADNIGMTTIDLSANTALKNLYVNNNQLTTVDVSNMVAGLYLYANNNQLTSIVAGESNVTSKSRVQITNNNFTLATLPAFTAISKVGTTGYNYAPQAAMTIATEITEGEELDLSAQNNIVGRASEAQATDYTWYTTEGEEFTSYTEVDGKFVFDVEADTELYCTMTTEAFSSFSGANAFKTTNIVVKYVAVERKVQFKSSDITMGTVQIISPSQGGTGTGGTGTGGTGTSGTGTSGTGTSGTGTGSATSGGGQSPWVITTEDVTAQANVQGNAYEFVNWTIGEEVVGTETTYTYTGKEEALIQANFRQKETYKTITIDVRPVVKDEYGTNIVGSVKFQGRSGKTTIIEEGSSLTVVATSKDGYEFSSWKDASTGEDVSFDAEYTFTVAGDINLEAWFSELPVVTTYEFVVSIAPTADYGTITINGVEGTSATVVEGTEVTAVATPAEGKVFDGWYTYMGEELSTELTYTFVATADLAIQAWFADETPEVVEYCTYEGNSTHSQRRLNAFTITDGTNTTAVSSIQPSLRGAIYVDKTDVAFPSYAGATVDFSEFDFKGEWMHAYVYVDYNNDGTFDTTVNADGTTGGELVSFTFYSATDSGTGVNSLGESVANYTIPMVDYLPAFTLPTDLEDGDYRVRVKIDWCHLDPCGHPSESENTLTENGGCIADFTMSISDFNGVEFTEVGATQVYAADGVIYINGYEGEVKVVNVAGQVVKDVNVDGNDTLEVAAGLYIVVTGDQVTKVVVK
ncbi:MAG: InlB B-repeat-containing protein [Muribaculaceae bacterium]|nr:InlB B-repeat-containing protein [Muribaculaceae bacterium]